MHISALAAALWLADGLGSLLLLSLLLRLNMARQWPSLIALLSGDIAVWVVLFLIHGNYRWYFYAYWIWSAVESAVRMWVLADCLRSIPGTSFIPKHLRIAVFTAAIGIAAIVSLSTFHGGTWVGHSTLARSVLDAVLLYNRATCFAALAFTAVALATTSILGLGWDFIGARIVSGLALQLAVTAFQSAVITEPSPLLRTAASRCASVSHLAVLSIWFVAAISQLSVPSHRRVVRT